MVDPRLYDSDTFVLLEPDQPEQFLSAEELLKKLETVLANCPNNLPQDLYRFSTVHEQAKYLLEAYCDFDIAPGQYMQWYVVRLEK